VNPNEFLELASWPTLLAFEIHTDSAEKLPPEAVQVAMEIARIPNPGTRKAVAGAILTLVKKYFEE
jgi:GMP synthase-like glutamine amidotransferase